MTLTPARQWLRRAAFWFWFSVFPVIAGLIAWDNAHTYANYANSMGAVVIGLVIAVPIALAVLGFVAFVCAAITETQEETFSGLVLGAAISIFVCWGVSKIYEVIRFFS